MLMKHLWASIALFAAAATTVPAERTRQQQQQQHENNNHHHRSINNRDAQDIISRLNLAPNVERGFWAETFRDDITVSSNSNRSISTAIYYLLEGSSGPSRWHKLDATEVWHYYAGAPMAVYLSANNGSRVDDSSILGPDIFNEEKNERPQVVIPRHVWQSVESLGEWTLVGTTVAPGFVSEKLATDGWEPQ